MTKRTVSELEIELAGEKAQTQFARDRAEERNTENKKLQKKITVLKRMVANSEAKINRMAGYLDRVHEAENPEKRTGNDRRGGQSYHGESFLNPTFNHSGSSRFDRDPDEKKEWFEL